MSDQETNPAPEKLVSDLLADDPDMYDLVEEFVSGLAERIDELRHAYENLDWDTLAKLAHQLKGAGGSYGYPEVSGLGAKMEEAFRNHSGDQFDQWIKNMQHLIAAARAGLTDSQPA